MKLSLKAISYSHYSLVGRILIIKYKDFAFTHTTSFDPLIKAKDSNPLSDEIPINFFGWMP